ncbi:MAG TPA: hypothetical protein VFO19_05965 [Vicinamibacterales bacterium]|nr:hypothetical protein [Vicinamibacterales bacterium]
MPSNRAARVAAGTLVVCLSTQAPPALAQGVELMLFGGYRLGGDFFELVAGDSVDLDISPALGVVVDVPLSDGLQLEALVTRQQAYVPVPVALFEPPALRGVTVGHAQVGGLQELSAGRVRPFVTGVLGLTRYAGAGDSEVRFTIGAGGGVKLFPYARVGLRVDGRLFTTFVDAEARFVACAPGTCVTALHVDVVWQAELTAGVVLRLR